MTVITTTPLPGLGDLLRLRFLRAPDGRALARPWLRDGDLGALWLSRSAWSLAALADAFTRSHGRQPVVALPDYLCNGSLGPLRHAARHLEFHPVAADLAPVLDGLERIDILVLVHYFGRPNPGTAAARAFCDRRGTWLVEDAAHVLRPVEGIGQAGDAVLYSPHKLLAAPDGALLVVRPGLAAAEGHLAAAVAALGGAHPHTSGWRTKRLLQRSPLGPALMRRRPGGQRHFDTDPAPAALAATPAPSTAGAALIAHADLEAAAAARSANATALAEAVRDRAAWTPLFPDSNDFAPYRLALRCADHATAVALYARLRAAPLPVESWPDLPPEAKAAGVARSLRATLLFLPCHQGLLPDALAAAYRRALA